MITYAVKIDEDASYKSVMGLRKEIEEYSHIQDYNVIVKDNVAYMRVSSSSSLYNACKESGWGYTLPIGRVNDKGWYTSGLKVINIDSRGFIQNKGRAKGLEELWGTNYNSDTVCFLFESDMMTPYEVLKYVLNTDTEFEVAVKEDGRWRPLSHNGDDILPEGHGYRDADGSIHLYPIIRTEGKDCHTALYINEDDDGTEELAVLTIDEFRTLFRKYEDEGRGPTAEDTYYYDS